MVARRSIQIKIDLSVEISSANNKYAVSRLNQFYTNVLRLASAQSRSDLAALAGRQGFALFAGDLPEQI